MPYQVMYSESGLRKKSKIVFPRRSQAEGYAHFLNAENPKRDARPVKSTRKPNNR